MDATAQLALLMKAKRVFESSGSFLSFPLTPMAYPPELLDFGKAMGDPRTGATLLEFSRYVNQCPTGTIFRGDSDQYLWEHYDRWLNAMDLARGEFSADQEAAYAQARSLLVVADANGLATDSPAVSLYKQYRDRYFDAVQAYKSAQMTAGNLQDAAAQAQWRGVDEPRLRQAVDFAQAAWVNDGRRAAIEAAQATVASFEARAPRKVWEGWRHAYNPDLDVFVDAASNASCAPSGFAPADIGAQPWTTFELTAMEIAALAVDASSELLSIFSVTGPSTVSSLSFEFRSAAVVRPWFNSALFDARFWKFADGSPDLSDGGSPPQGAWPAYVSAVVFVRKIRLAMASAPPQVLSVLPALLLRPQALLMMRDHRFAAPAAPPAPAPAPAQVATAASFMLARAALAQPAAAPMRPAAAMALRAAVPPRAVTVTPVQRLNTAMIYRAPPPAQAPPRQPQPAAPPQPDEKISILAFICRPLHKVPDPDPALDWGG